MAGNVSRCWETQRNPEPVAAGPEPDREGKRGQVSRVEWGTKGGESAAVLKESCSAREGNKINESNHISPVVKCPWLASSCKT